MMEFHTLSMMNNGLWDGLHPAQLLVEGPVGPLNPMVCPTDRRSVMEFHT